MMNAIRTLMIGCLVGGGIGAKVGAYITTVMKSEVGWPYIEFSLEVGAGLGCIASFVLILIRSHVMTPFENERKREAKEQLAVGGV
ncbi:MAG: hypothetical protein AAF551_11790 [Bacteroidota bacterium]